MSSDEVQSLLEENEGLVWFVLNKHYPQFIKDDDMYQIGMIALWKAIEAYDFSKSKFSTYAVKCIRNAIGCELRRLNRKSIKNEVFISDLAFEDDADGGWESSEVNKNVSTALRHVEEHVILEDALNSLTNNLTEFQKKCFRSYLNSENGTEAARSLGISRGSMTTTVSRVKTRMIKCLRNGGCRHEYS